MSGVSSLPLPASPAQPPAEVVSYQPLARANAIAGAAVLLPRPLHAIMIGYAFELPAPRGLLKRCIVEGGSSARAEEVFMFDRIAAIFQELLQLGNDWGIQREMENSINSCASTYYGLQWESEYASGCHEQNLFNTSYDYNREACLKERPMTESFKQVEAILAQVNPQFKEATDVNNKNWITHAHIRVARSSQLSDWTSIYPFISTGFICKVAPNEITQQNLRVDKITREMIQQEPDPELQRVLQWEFNDFLKKQLQAPAQDAQADCCFVYCLKSFLNCIFDLLCYIFCCRGEEEQADAAH